MMDSSCIVSALYHSIMLLLIQKCYIYVFCYVCVYHFMHNIIFDYSGTFLYFRLFFLQITENYFALLLYFCNLYVQNYFYRIISY